MIMYFKAFGDSRTAEHSPFMSKLLLTETPDQSSNPPKLAPVTMVFVLCQGSRGVV